MDTQYSSCIYRSKDPVKNFKIKVSLHKAAGKLYLNDSERARANVKSEKDERDEKDEDKEEKKDQPISIMPEKEDANINWQVKMFSRREFIKYSDPSFIPKNNLEEHYNKKCLELRERDFFPGRIFTFIDSDPYEFYDEIDGEVHSAPKDIVPTYLENVKGASLRNRRPLIGKAKSDEESIPHNNIVSYDSSKEDVKRRDVKLRPFHTMYIMADLSNLENKLYDEVPEGKSKREKNKIIREKIAKEKERARYERVLCCIRIDSNGCIVMKPKFNLTGVPYLVQTSGFVRETYQYSLEHVSGTITADNLLKEHRLHKELYMRHSEYLKNLVGKDFKMPNIGVLKVHVFGEIISAKNFDYDDLHVYYQLELPKNWHVDRTSPISGFTQTCRVRTNTFNDDEVAYFAHPFELDLYYKNDEMNSNNKDELPKMPKVLFEVASYDSWNRYRTEGYTWTQIPVKPGTCQEEKVCWRPRGDSIIYELRRFFIGGSPELEDISYACIPADYDGKILSRYGFRTTTTGSLTIKMNVAYQSQLFLGKTKTKEQSNLLNKIGNYSSMNDLIKALEELNMARLRMIEARENAKKLLGD